MKVLDAHFDLLSLIAHRRNQGKTHVFEKELYPQLKAGHVKILVASLFLEGHQLQDPFYYAMEQIGCFYEELRESPELMMLIKSKDDLKECLATDKIGFLLSFEGAEPLKRPRDLVLFYELGVRFMGLTWSRRNAYADGCDYDAGLRKGGLSKLGLQLLEEAKKLGVIPDASHLSQESFEDLINLDMPFVSSHSNAYSLTPIPRSILDKDLDLLKDRDYCLGVNAAHFILTRDGETSSIADFVAHTDYLIKKLGPDKVGLGLDLCDCLDHFDGAMSGADILAHHGELPALTQALVQHFGQEMAEKIAFDNWYNFLMRHL